MYAKNSPVLQVDAKSYERLIARSNHTSMVEFYAPWCGHCRNLQPAYEKAAKNLAGLAKIAAVDCDEEGNKAFCGSMGVQGFPTLKIVQPGSKAGRPKVEDYQGPRTAKGIVDAMIEKIPNHVKRIGDKGLDGWLKQGNDTAKAILFSSKGTTSALLKSLAVDFLGGISFAQVRDKDKAVVEVFGVSEFPTLMLLPGGTKEAVVYTGEMKKEPMVTFLAQASPPNPDPAPKKAKDPKSEKKPSKKEQKKSADAKSSLNDASSIHASSEASEAAASATAIDLEDEGLPTESPDAAVAPSDAPRPVPVAHVAPPIPKLETLGELQKACLSPKSKTCVVVLLPAVGAPDVAQPESATAALQSLAEIAEKFRQHNVKLFPLYAVPGENVGSTSLRSSLKLTEGLELVAMSTRRGWWTRFGGTGYGFESLESWIDAIRLGEAGKEKLPDGIAVEESEVREEEEEKKKREEAEAEAGTQAEAKAEAEAEKTGGHDEL
ncbi:MAG: hypothetical protein M1832_001744 [Thelocarpon impressellum]|nr:MAG: hypothetical protein M1832_001744 [Thelocarpon impressellum]